MISPFEAWLRLLPVWASAVLLAVLSGGYCFWQSSGSMGTEARLGEQISNLEQSIEQLQQTRKQVIAERAEAAQLSRQVKRWYEEGFGSLEERLTGILRAVGSATREASGLRPASFSYAATEDKRHRVTRFSIRFSVLGSYQQLRQMLQALEESPEFFVVSKISLSGEQQATNDNISINLEVATYLSKVDQALLDRLQRGLVDFELSPEDGGEHQQEGGE